MSATRRVEYELPREIQCLAVTKDPETKSNMVAVGIKNVVKILSLNMESEPRKITECATATVPREGYVTDVSWNPHQNTSFLLCHSKGIIKAFNLENGQGQGKALINTWSCQHDDNYIIKLSWNAGDRKVFGAAIKGAPVKLFDTSKAKFIASLPGKGARDICFHPQFAEFLLVGDVDNVVKVYDRRKLDDHLFKIEPFDKSSSLTRVAWFDNSDASSFITCSNNAVKVWQASSCLLPVGDAARSVIMVPEKVHDIFVPGSMKSVLVGDRTIVTLSQVSTDAEAATVTSLFDLESSYTAQSVMRDKAVTCIDWIDHRGDKLIISGGHDGRLQIVDPVQGYHPRQEINKHVATISSQGHLAVHNPAHFGKVVCGLASFQDLDAVREKRRGAEGAVSDPALLQLLARSYRLPWNLTPSAYNLSTAMEAYRAAIAACQENIHIANRAGLRSRAAVWSALIALLPNPSVTVQSVADSNNSTSSAVASTTDDAQLQLLVQLSDTQSLLDDILQDLLDVGDSLHFVLVREMVRRTIIGTTIGQTKKDIDGPDVTTTTSTRGISSRSIDLTSSRRITQMYMAYVDLLRRLTLPHLANDILKYVEDPVLADRARADVNIKLSCALCQGSELRNREINIKGATSYCLKCRICVSYCSVCCRPAAGLVQWCVVCGHGGHFRCLQWWFRQQQHRQCPAGCGHRCCNPKMSHSPNVPLEMKRPAVPTPIAASAKVVATPAAAVSAGNSSGAGAAGYRANTTLSPQEIRRNQMIAYFH